MSRSKKKHPWVKDSSNTHMKKVHARRMRRKVKVILHVYRKTAGPDDAGWSFYWNEEDDYWGCRNLEAVAADPDPVIPHYRSVTNQYDVCDYKFYGEEPAYARK